jgi:hypothetical protein
MTLCISTDSDGTSVSVRDVPVTMRDSEVKQAVLHAASQGCARAARALQLVYAWCDMSVCPGTTRVYRDDASVEA